MQKEFESVKLGVLGSFIVFGFFVFLENTVIEIIYCFMMHLHKVNNAGMSHELPEKFGDADLQRVRDIINVNIVAVNELTRVALPSLLKNQQANLRGLIINVGSASGLLPTPLLACYGASKAYLSSFSSSLQREYGKLGVDCDCAVAFFVVSNMSKRKYATAMIPSPESFVRQSLAKVTLFYFILFFVF